MMEETDAADEADEDHCVVCGRETKTRYRDMRVCGGCKKFHQKCVKSKCFRDFCCHQNTRCNLGHKTPCSFCWWNKCVSLGLSEK